MTDTIASASPVAHRPLAVRGLELTIVEQFIDPHARVVAHAHEQAVLSLTLAGAWSERLGASEQEHTPGSSSFLPSAMEHSVAVGTRPVHCFNVELPPSYTGRLREVDGRPLELVNDRRGPVTWLVARLHDEVSSRGSGCSLIVEGLLLEILGTLSRVRSESSAEMVPRWLRVLDELLEAEFRERITVAELAARVGVHPVHLSRTWRRFRGCSIGESLQRTRIAAACERLAEGAPSLADLALEVGFADQTHFTRVFKQCTGMTPGSYRSQFSS